MALKKGIKAEKPALTLNFDKEAADDLEYIAKLIEQDTGATISLALGILKKIAGERKRGHRTYIDIGRGRKEEILVGQVETPLEKAARLKAEMDMSMIYPTERELLKREEEIIAIKQDLAALARSGLELRDEFKRLVDLVSKQQKVQ